MRDLVDAVVQVVSVLREQRELAGLLGGEALELVLCIAQHLDERLGGLQTAGHDLFIRLLLAFVINEVPCVLAGTGLDHGDGDVAAFDHTTGHHDLEHGALTFAPTRERDPLAVDQGEPHATDRAGERQAGDERGGGGRVQGEHVVGILRVHGEHGLHDLHLVAQRVREERA